MEQSSTSPDHNEADPKGGAAKPGGAGMARNIGGFTAATLASRILGFFRDAAVVYTFGRTYTDAYYAGFRIANFFRRTLGEGSLTSSFVPVLSREKIQGRKQARDFLKSLRSWVLLAAGGISVLGVLFARPLVFAITYGFTVNPSQFRLTVGITRVMFPHLLFVTMAAVCQGTLYVVRRFFLPAFSPIMFSVAILTYLGLLHFGFLPVYRIEHQVLGLAIVATAGGLLQWLVLLPALKRDGFPLRFGKNLGHPGIRQVLALMIPSMVAMATDQVGMFVDTICASFLAVGAMTAIYNSNRIMQLPLALFGVATANVALPRLSEDVSRGRMDEFKKTLNTSLRFLGFILFPSMVGLMILSLPTVRLLFERGAFSYSDSLITHTTLQYYTLGLAAYAGTKLLVSAFYSLRDAVTPLKVGAVEVAINIALALVLMGPMGVGGLALAASISAWVGCSAMAFLLQRRIPFLSFKSTALPLLKSLAASLAMGVLCIFILEIILPNASPWLSVPFTIGAAIPAYFGLASVLGIEERHMVKAAFYGVRS